MTVSHARWRTPSANLALSSQVVHVWRASLEQATERVQQLSQWLSPDERERAVRFHFERDRRRFIVCRGVLRMIFSRYLGIEPDQVQFRYRLHGKPDLSERLGDGTLQFNLAHSNELAIYAFTYNREVGIDLEYIHPVPDAEQVALRFFSAGENATLQRLDKSQRLEGFFNCWTRKEAWVKALGDGLTQPLEQFDVSLVPGEPARLLRVARSPKQVTGWSLRSLAPAHGYVGALAVEGSDWHLECWQCLL